MKTELSKKMRFALGVLILFWMMPNTKIEAIGNFLERLTLIVSIVFGGKPIADKLINKFMDNKPK